MPHQSNAPSYVWFYWKPEPERQVYEPIRHARHGSVYGWFTGYFHFVPKPQIVNGAFAPGPLQFEGVEVFIPDPNPRSLSEAIREGDLEEARRILRSGAKINIWDEDKTFPLFEAISSRHADFAEELLAAGADPKLITPGGDTALMQATWYSDVGIAKALLDCGGPVNATDDNGLTGLILVIHKGSNGKMVQLLLDAGANPNVKTLHGTTALIAAAMEGDGAAAGSLVKTGADPALEDE